MNTIILDLINPLTADHVEKVKTCFPTVRTKYKSM